MSISNLTNPLTLSDDNTRALAEINAIWGDALFAEFWWMTIDGRYCPQDDGYETRFAATFGPKSPSPLAPSVEGNVCIAVHEMVTLGNKIMVSDAWLNVIPADDYKTLEQVESAAARLIDSTCPCLLKQPGQQLLMSPQRTLSDFQIFLYI